MPQPREITATSPLLPHLQAYPPQFTAANHLAQPAHTSHGHHMQVCRHGPSSGPDKSGQLYCFGSAVGGELGLIPATHERRKPGLLKLLDGKGVVAVECGGQHSLALDSTGRVWSWGVNDQGALGRLTEDGHDEDDYEDLESIDDQSIVKGTEAFLPLPVPLGAGVRVVQMVCADSFSAVLTADGDVYAWGSFRDPSGVIGFSKEKAHGEHQMQPVKISAFVGTAGGKVVLLGSGENHIFAVTDTDTVWAFGANDEYQLGRRVSSRLKNNLEPYEIRGVGKFGLVLHNIVKITGGAYHTLFINSRGELFSFGCNNCGQLGQGDVMSHVSGPERVEFYIAADGKTRMALPPVVDIAAGESHSLAVTADGRVLGWGANLEGQLGYRCDVPVFGDDRDATFLQDFERKQALLKKKGKRADSMNMPPVYEESSSSASSSANSTPHKSFGDSAISSRDAFKLKYQPLPRELPAFMDFNPAKDKIVSVAAQSRFSQCISESGNLYTWGSGHSYQLGNEKMEDELYPFKVELKNRKCFWARCGGQFTMFLLEPKQQSDGDTSSVPVTAASAPAVSFAPGTNADPEAMDQDTPVRTAVNRMAYRPSAVVMPSSMPDSPFNANSIVPRTDAPSEPSSTNISKQSNRSVSPTQDITLRLTEAIVSPDGKRNMRNAMQVASIDGPWSPTKKRHIDDTPTSSVSNLVGSNTSLAGSQEISKPRRKIRNLKKILDEQTKPK